MEMWLHYCHQKYIWIQRFLLSCHRCFIFHHYPPMVSETFEHNFNTLCCICQSTRRVFCNTTSKLAFMDGTVRSLRDFKKYILIQRPVWNAYLQCWILRNIFYAATICRNAKLGVIAFVSDDIENTDVWEKIQSVVPEAGINGREK